MDNVIEISNSEHDDNVGENKCHDNCATVEECVICKEALDGNLDHNSICGTCMNLCHERCLHR